MHDVGAGHFLWFVEKDFVQTLLVPVCCRVTWPNKKVP